ncbi:di- and tripeptidase [Kwoniella heveanensis BCC8398]|uniref:Di-and tripeptidase n=1 Tax=Kwoniella heveanensis BCC8398 TaxID=1296120 RepID=A0A1B9GHY2_9TREE|nr:di- and tripeptidase [Kwoniella heveanensis BCC8398]
MSLTDSRILPNLYDGLATPPLSPIGLGSQPRFFAPTRSRPLSPLHRVSISTTAATITPAPTAPSSPLANAKPTSIPQPHHAHAADASPSSPAPSPAQHTLPIGSLQPTQFPLTKSTCSHIFPSTFGNGLHLSHEVDSLTRERKGKMPALSHLLSVGNARGLSLAADERYVYAGCQSADNEITVFSRASLQPMYRLMGHQGSVLALLLIQAKDWLVSASSAGDVRIWSTKTLELIYIIHPCDDTAGDIYSLAWDDREGGTLYLGSQSASIEWVNFAGPGPDRKRQISAADASKVEVVPLNQNGTDPVARPNGTSGGSGPSQRSGRYKPSKFFDNPPSGACSASGASTPRSPAIGGATSIGNRKEMFSSADLDKLSLNERAEHPATELEIGAESRIAFAHYGYIYALQMITRPDGKKWLVSGSGDSDVKIWECELGGGLTLVREFDNLPGGVLSFAVRDSLLYAGLQAGEIVVWDLETGACIRTIEAHDADVLSMSVLGGEVYTAAADGRVFRVNEEFDCTAAFKGHNGTVMSTAIVKSLRGNVWELITTGSDSFVKIWNIEVHKASKHDDEVDVDVEGEGDVMLYALSKLVAVPTVSDEAHRESCRQGAHLLKKILSQLGANTHVLSGEQGKNPLVLATFEGRDTGKPRKRLLFYGHYDVQPAAEEKWETNPWELSGRNGYLYGRGVTDNKGPILAVACAAASLRQRRELDVDLVMIIEGEEEAGSRGFAPAVRKHKDQIGHIDAILLSNSTWIDEQDPCVVFGMRGVVYAKLIVASKDEDLHNGVDGGATAEPMIDMVKLLGALSDAKGVKVPGFYDSVRPSTPEEMSLLSEVASASGRPLEELIRVWRQPSFSIANITSSGSGNKTVIPKRVCADISMRIVPDQKLDEIVRKLKEFCTSTFEDLGSPNSFEIQVTHSASWWLASLDSPYLKALESSVQDVWGVKPLKIREGGTVPTVFWLEKEFGAPCVHLPLGQSSDAGHLANERMRLLNLRNGKRVIEAYLSRLAKI